MKYFYLLLCFFVIQLSCGQNQISDELRTNIEKRIEYNLHPSIAIGIVDKSGTNYHTFGNKRIGGAEVDEHSIYEIGSISKVFTAILLADQIVKGNMSVDDDIAMYLPKSVKAPTYEGKSITLGHLSDHTSSLPRMPDNFDPADPDNPYADYTPELLYEFISEVELTRPIGSEYEYSNLAQGLLGHILELKTGKDFETLLREIITEPLNMNETRVAFDKNMKANLAIGHDGGVETSNWDIATLTGAGAIRSSVHDMSIFLAASLGLIETPLAEAIALTQKIRHDKAGGSTVGLGWHIRIDEETQKQFIAHSGATGGYRAFSAINKEDGKGVILLSNSTASPEDIGRYLIGASDELEEPKRDLAHALEQALDQKGIAAMKARYEEIKANNTDEFDMNESTLNSLGYKYMSRDKIDEALAIFEVNIKAHPEAFNTYDSYGEALMRKSIESYEKSVELNPANQNGIDMLAKMGVDIETEDAVVDNAILDSYVGKYELAPTFAIVITHEDGKLHAQATGQQKLELFAQSDTRFYLKVVDAQIEFFKDAAGAVESLTLFQNGRESPGKKVE